VFALAEDSINFIPRLSANSFPSSKVTYLFDSKSHLLPTRSLITFSFACFSTSNSLVSFFFTCKPIFYIFERLFIGDIVG
jgi:hypothetical protein